MPASAMLTMLRKDKMILIKFLKELYECACVQRRVLSEANAPDVSAFCARKKKLAGEVTRFLGHIEKVRQDVSMKEKQRNELNIFFESLRKDCQPLMQKIVEQEKHDEEFLKQLKKEISAELAQIQEANVRLKSVKNSYLEGYNQSSQVFDSEG